MSKIQFTGTATQPQRNRIFRQFNKDQYCTSITLESVSGQIASHSTSRYYLEVLTIKVKNRVHAGNTTYSTHKQKMTYKQYYCKQIYLTKMTKHETKFRQGRDRSTILERSATTVNGLQYYHVTHANNKLRKSSRRKRNKTYTHLSSKANSYTYRHTHTAIHASTR